MSCPQTMNVLFRILSIASLLLLFPGVFLLVASVYVIFASGFWSFLQTLFFGGIFIALGLAAFVGFWTLADRMKT